MSKFIPVLICMIGLQFAVRADYLWWVADEPMVTYQDGVSQATSSTDEIWLWKDGERLFITDIRVKAVKDGVSSYLTVGIEDGPGYESIPVDVPVYSGEAWAALIPSAYASEGYSFVIEMGNWETGEWLLMASNEASYNDLRTFITAQFESQPERYFTEEFTGAPGVIPEPTSGVLVLIGFGLISLRRRRRW